MLFWIIAGLAALLLVARLMTGPLPPAVARRPVTPPAPDDEDPETALDMLAHDAPAALARYGTPEVAQMLEAQGRGDELRGLGYRAPED